MAKKAGLAFMLAAAFAYASSALAQNQQRIVEPIIVNGQHAQGVLIVQNETILTHTCESPQPYATANQSETGWACFDQASGIWLLRAQPPVEAAAPAQQPTVVYTQPSPVYIASSYPFYSSYPYYPYYPYYSFPYGYYGFPYSYFVGPRFGFGFGFRSSVIVGRPFIGGRSIGRFGTSHVVAGGFGRAGGRAVSVRGGRR